MKKILLLLLSISLFFGVFLNNSYADCDYDVDIGSVNIGSALDDCLKNSKLIKGNNLNIENGSGFETQIKGWVNNISLYLGIFAVGAIIIGSLMMTLSVGEEEKIKKAKDIVKWGLIGFIALITVSAIINVIIKLMYSI